MNMRWNLDKLYPSFESDEFKTDLKKVDELLDNFSEWAEKTFSDDPDSKDVMERYISFSMEIHNTLSRLSEFSELTWSVEAKNETAMKMSEVLEEKKTKLTTPDVLFMQWLGKVENFDEVVDSSETLKEHRFFLSELKKKASHLLGKSEENIISSMKRTGSTAWSNLWNNLSSNLLVEIEDEGEKKALPLPIVRNMAYDGNAEKRKRAFDAEIAAYSKIEEPCAACLNGIKGEVITTSAMRKFESPMALTLESSRMEKSTLDAMLSAMREFLPSFRSYLKKKAELLGHKGSLPFYDLFAPMGEKEMTFTYDEAHKFIVENFAKFSEKLSDFADHAFKNNWIDAEPREGKRGGAFCANLHSIGESRVLSNFTGSFSDVRTLAHELGHAYHGLCLKDETILNSDYPMPIAETASIFCETIINDAALEKATREEAFGILEADISSATQVIVDILSRFIFESTLFERERTPHFP